MEDMREVKQKIGITLRILSVVDEKTVVVSDELDNTKEVSKRDWLKGEVKWKEFGVFTRKTLHGRTNNIIETDSYGKFIILGVPEGFNTRRCIMFLNTGFIKTVDVHERLKGTSDDSIKSLPKEKKIRTIKGTRVGDTFMSISHGVYVVEKIDSCNEVYIRFLNTDNTYKFSHHQIKINVVKDLKIIPAVIKEVKQTKKKFLISVGCNYEMKDSSFVEVIEMYSDIRALVKFIDTGSLVETSRGEIKNGLVKDPAKHWDYLKPLSGFHYVYIVKYLGEIVYIGKGFGRRYLHASSGTSHCLELNRLYFNNEKVEVSIHMDGLTNNQSIEIERELINKIRPPFNSYTVNGKPR